jgi:anion-transporting  ArsA/GET3 family ATPase
LPPLARIGPVHNHADTVMKVVRSPETAVHFVTLLEEMPVQETADAVAELTTLGLPVGRIIVNAVRTAPLAGEPVLTAPQAALRAGLAAAGLPTDRATVAGLHAQTRWYAARERLEERLRADLAELDPPTVDLPLLPDLAERAALDTLVTALRDP